MRRVSLVRAYLDQGSFSSDWVAGFGLAALGPVSSVDESTLGAFAVFFVTGAVFFREARCTGLVETWFLAGGVEWSGPIFSQDFFDYFDVEIVGG